MDPGKKLNQVQLIEQVVLEPQDDLVLRRGGLDRLVAPRQLIANLTQRPVAAGGQKSRPQLAPFRQVQSVDQRPLVQRVGAFDDAARDPGLAKQTDDDISVGEVDQRRWSGWTPTMVT